MIFVCNNKGGAVWVVNVALDFNLCWINNTTMWRSTSHTTTTASLVTTSNFHVAAREKSEFLANASTTSATEPQEKFKK